MNDRTVTLEQVGSRGTIIFETSFGLSFTIDRKRSSVEDTSKRGLKSRAAVGYNLITVLSSCCQSMLSRNADHRYACWKCGALSSLPDEYVSREYPDLTKEDNILAFERIVATAGLDSLEVTLVSDSLIQLIRELWSAMEDFQTTRTLLTMEPYNSPIVL